MKRLLIFLLLGLSLTAVQPFKQDILFDNQQISRACVISKYKNNFDDCEYIIKNGNQYLHYASRESIKSQMKNFKQVDGIVLYFEQSSLKELVAFYKIDYFKGGDLLGYQVFYGYTTFYSDYKYISNKKINVQIAVASDHIIIGFPMILTGF